MKTLLNNAFEIIRGAIPALFCLLCLSQVNAGEGGKPDNDLVQVLDQYPMIVYVEDIDLKQSKAREWKVVRGDAMIAQADAFRSSVMTTAKSIFRKTTKYFDSIGLLVGYDPSSGHTGMHRHADGVSPSRLQNFG